MTDELVVCEGGVALRPTLASTGDAVRTGGVAERGGTPACSNLDLAEGAWKEVTGRTEGGVATGVTWKEVGRTGCMGGMDLR